MIYVSTYGGSAWHGPDRPQDGRLPFAGIRRVSNPPALTIRPHGGQSPPITRFPTRLLAGHAMKDWTRTFDENLWLKPDGVGDEEAAFIAKALHLRRGQSVLDAPCGAGRIVIHLARRGCNLTGIDLRSSFTDRATARFRRERQGGRFMPMDLRAMDFREEFHAAYAWLGSFGYFSDADNLAVLKRYASALRGGGRLLVDQPNREAMLRHFVPRHDRRGCSIRNRWNQRVERMESAWVADRNGMRQHNRMSIRLYTAAQMRRLFEQAGLRVEAMYGGRDGERYTRGSRRLIVVGRK